MLIPLFGLACGTAPPEATTPRQAATDDLVTRTPSRGTARGGERMRRTVRWPAAASRDDAAYGALSRSSRAAVDASPVPVLVPAPGHALGERRVMQGPEWAAFWARGEGITVSLHASRMARVYPGVRLQDGPHTLRGRPAVITRNEGIWTASWLEHGVAYDLELECTSPEDPPCADESLLVELGEALTYVGGRGEEGVR